MSIQTASKQPVQTVISIPLNKLLPHPGNPNRMSEAAFAKLVRNLERTGQYEPLAVRPHPLARGAYQILNGHHRARALRRLGRSCADCVVFRADDGEAMVYLATLNRLCGRDNIYKKTKLIEALCRRFTSKDLARRLPDSRIAIEKLNRLALQQPEPKPKPDAPLLLPMTFFVTEAQHALISEAFAKALSNESAGTPTEKRLRGLLRLAEHFIGKA
jgi:hypothetical protein